MEKLLEGKCEACKADAPLVSADEKKELMPQIPGWNIIEVDGIEQLTCSFAFKDYLSALNFVNQVANLAEEEDHKVLLRLWLRQVRDNVVPAAHKCLQP